MKLAVASGKGGTGKTFFSTCLFAELTRSGRTAALVDCDAEVPDAVLFFDAQRQEEEEVRVLCPEIDAGRCDFCGLCAENCRFHALSCIPAARYIRLFPDLCHGCGACVAECPREAVVRAYKTVGKVTVYEVKPHAREGTFLVEARLREGERSPVPVIRQAKARAEAFGAEFLILDAPPGCSCPFVHTVADADAVALVAEPTPFGWSDLRHTVEVLRRMGKKFGVVLNRADLGDGRLKAWLAEEGIPLLAEIPFSRDIASLYAQGSLALGRLDWLDALFAQFVERLAGFSPA